jgi:hypothetical protein
MGPCRKVSCVQYLRTSSILKGGEKNASRSTMVKYGISTIWWFAKDSGLRPCSIYLRHHCVLASKSMGPECHDSFLDDTNLVDRATTSRLLGENPSSNDNRATAGYGCPIRWIAGLLSVCQIVAARFSLTRSESGLEATKTSYS